GVALSQPERVALPEHLLVSDFSLLSDGDCAEILSLARAQDLRIHAFKRTMGLPRVRKVIGWLRGFRPDRLLDIGSGRGAFLWPLLDEFPSLSVTALDLREDRISAIEAVARGGFPHLSGKRFDITLSSPSSLLPADVVTALEVWEHIPNLETAARFCLDHAEEALIVSVPSQEDENPEHIHLLTKDKLTSLLGLRDRRRIRFDSVPGHLLAVATSSERDS
ncbi:MAG: class I SAM-dependent methyltransferase, partial [Verrucomicrobiota bacterium]